MWSIGVIVYVCLLGKLPFKSLGESESLKQAVGKMFAGNELDGLSDSAKEFLAGLFALSAKDRFSAKQASEHPWIRYAPHCAEGECCGPHECGDCVASHDASQEGGDDSQKPTKKTRSSAPPVPRFSQNS